jgi:hypothetical protein
MLHKQARGAGADEKKGSNDADPGFIAGAMGAAAAGDGAAARRQAVTALAVAAYSSILSKFM